MAKETLQDRIRRAQEAQRKLTAPKDKPAPKPTPKPKPTTTTPPPAPPAPPAPATPEMEQDPLVAPSLAPVLDSGRPEQAITPEGRMDAAKKALGDTPDLSASERQAVEAYQAVFPDQKIDLSPMGLRAITDWHIATKKAARPQAAAAQRRADIVEQLEEVYGSRGLPLPEAYNVPYEERSFIGGGIESLADALDLSIANREAARKRKVDPTIESGGITGFLEQASEVGTYPVRKLLELITGAPLSEPYATAPPIVDPDSGLLGSLVGESRKRTIRETDPSRVRPVVESGDTMYGLRDVDAINEDLERAITRQENPMMDFYEFYAQNNPEKAEGVSAPAILGSGIAPDPEYKGLLESQARKHMEAKARERKGLIEALLAERELVEEYKKQIRGAE